MEKRRLSTYDIDRVRHIEGFPIAKDDDIIALSDAPYYTACPNPFIEEFVAEYGTPYDEATDDYQREPFAADVSEGKSELLYNLHTYHTKVPYKAIMKYILHYTKPGDIVLDGFAGTGMTGVAAQMCGSDDFQMEAAFKSEMKGIEWGARKAILCDLAPAATFIGRNYNTHVDTEAFLSKTESMLRRCEEECGWMYKTRHDGNSALGQMTLDAMQEQTGVINYTVWSDVLICPHCGEEIVFWDRAVQQKPYKVKDGFTCASCGAELKKRACKKAQEIIFDHITGETVSLTKQVPVLINYTYAGKRFEKVPDTQDIDVIKRIADMVIPYWYPTDKFPEGDKTGEAIRQGISAVCYTYTKRNLYTLSKLRSLNTDNDQLITFWLNSLDHGIGKRVKHGDWSFPMSTLPGTIYFPSLTRENNPLYFYQTKAGKIASVLGKMPSGNVIITTQSSADLSQIPSSSCDYIFTDPPFGDNIMYSELNYAWESWMRVKTNNKQEAIVNKTQKKSFVEYQELLEAVFAHYYRVLKPNRWMTVEFHNSRNSVWNAIQEALSKNGFIIADVRTLDKNQGSFNQVKGASQAIKQDLVITAYKPKESFMRDFQLKAGSEDTVWSFVRQHLEKLPVVVDKDGKIEIIAERQAFLLFDRMVAYHVMNGISVPLDATEFYRGLDERFLSRDNMYFLPNQVNEYDMARSTKEIENVQLSMFVSDEKSAIGWLYQQLDANGGDGPQTYQELMPKFMQELKAVDKREKMPELMTILEENFLKDEKGRWYIPDLTKSGDIAKLREKNLLKEFQQYMESKGKLKVFRSEAIRAGFAMLWKEKNYAAIVAMAERLPEETIQEDSNLLMYYDISLSRV